MADQALGRLDGIVRVVPDPDFFVGMYVRREAVLSSQIEGTQSTLEDLLEAELDPDKNRPGSDVGDIVNYVRAMNFGLERLSTLPLSLRLIREIHAELLRDGRGAHSDPGNFRRTQNWIGPPGAGLAQATFVPPPVPELQDALADFESFLHRPSGLPVIVDVGLAHAQFETIHPFLDGNGRVGRLLITLLLVRSGTLRRPLLYLSHYFKLHRAEYYDRLTAVRLAGDWEGWLGFFLRGVAATAIEAASTAERIFELRETARTAIIDAKLAQHGLPLLAALFQRPLLNVTVAAELIGTTFPTASRVIGTLEDLGYLKEITGQRRRRIYRFEPYLDLFTDLDIETNPASVEATAAAPLKDDELTEQEAMDLALEAQRATRRSG
ncbi:Fic family protein [Svornostia abyssi]|uniref:Fic family protein n=1 Tax=Svornostia abyssi TaxID=2898438 RepID=A0ABY5PGS7_9ACTN|nr:Fic family protein [Parviterribacteraceae bacterium J379]